MLNTHKTLGRNPHIDLYASLCHSKLMTLTGSLSSETCGITANYSRFYGRSDFTTSAGYNTGTVSVISAPDWDEYWKTLQYSSDSLGEVALSPELITLEFNSDIHVQQATVEQRVKDVTELSRDTPRTTFALGTPVFDPSFTKPTNSILFINDGSVTCRKDKAFIHPNTAEAKNFRTGTRPIGTNEKMASLVCSDLVNVACLQPSINNGATIRNKYPDLSVNSRTKLVLMSACWSTPLSWVAQSPIPDETRFRSQLEYCVGNLFFRFPGLNDLIIADRVAEGSRIIGPLNCHFARQGYTM